jgi:hypothetical protein
VHNAIAAAVYHETPWQSFRNDLRMLFLSDTSADDVRKKAIGMELNEIFKEIIALLQEVLKLVYTHALRSNGELGNPELRELRMIRPLYASNHELLLGVAKKYDIRHIRRYMQGVECRAPSKNKT